MNNPASQAVPDAPPIVPSTGSLAAPFGSVWASLFWKERCEHRWRLAALMAYSLVMLAGIVWSDHVKNDSNRIWSHLSVVIPLGALFLSASITAGEQSVGTINFYRALPAPRWPLALVKLLVCVGVLTTPILVALFGVPDPWLLGVLWLLSAASLVIWLAACGVNRGTEVRAAAIGLVGVVAVWSVSLGVSNRVERSLQERNAAINWSGPDVQSKLSEWGVMWERFTWWRDVLMAGAPGGMVVLDRSTPPGQAAAAGLLYSVVHGLLLWRWLAAFGTCMPNSGIGSKTTARSGGAMHLGPPRASPIAAIVWRQARDTAPVAVAALAIAVGWSVLRMMVTTYHDPSIYDGPCMTLWAVGAERVGAGTVQFAFLAAVVAGIGLFLDDLRPGLNTFWRSRPIAPTVWFWCKYASGIVCLSLTFGAAQLACILIWRWQAPDEAIPFAASYFAGIPGFVATYAAAVCACCLVRQPIYAAILAAGVVAMPTGVLTWTAAQFHWSEDFEITAMPLLLIAIAIATTWLAQWAVRRDWAILL